MGSYKRKDLGPNSVSKPGVDPPRGTPITEKRQTAGGSNQNIVPKKVRRWSAGGSTQKP